MWKEVEAEAEEDPEFLASLTEGQSSQSDVRQRLPGVPCDEEHRHESQLATNKHWIKWVDDGLSERADVGSKKARAALPASLR